MEGLELPVKNNGAAASAPSDVVCGFVEVRAARRPRGSCRPASFGASLSGASASSAVAAAEDFFWAALLPVRCFWWRWEMGGVAYVPDHRRHLAGRVAWCGGLFLQLSFRPADSGQRRFRRRAREFGVPLLRLAGNGVGLPLLVVVLDDGGVMWFLVLCRIWLSCRFESLSRDAGLLPPLRFRSESVVLSECTDDAVGSWCRRRYAFIDLRSRPASGGSCGIKTFMAGVPVLLGRPVGMASSPASVCSCDGDVICACSASNSTSPPPPPCTASAAEDDEEEETGDGRVLKAWERAYADDRSWEALQEDESGLLRPIDTKNLVHSQYRRRLLLRSAAAAARIQKGLIRYLYIVIDLSRSHFKELLLEHAPPPPAIAEYAAANLIKMGFPQRGAEDLVSICSCHKKIKSGAEGYICPRCKVNVCELPTECRTCGLTLVSSPHLARSYHHLFPVAPFDEVTFKLGQKGGQNCFGCQQSLINTGGQSNIHVRCPKCNHHFCFDCDIYIHESLHNCPGCESQRNSSR